MCSVQTRCNPRTNGLRRRQWPQRWLLVLDLESWGGCGPLYGAPVASCQVAGGSGFSSLQGEMGKGKKSAKSKSAGRRAVPAVHAALVPDTTAIAQDTTRLSEGATVQVTVESKDELESLKAATITTGQAVVQDAPTLETVVPFCPPPCGGPAVPLEQLMGSTTSTPTSDDVMLSEADWAEIEATMLGRVERRLSGQAVLPLPEAWLQEAEDHLLNQLSPTKERNCDYLDTPMTPGPPPELPQGLLRPVPESDENMNEEEMFRQLEADLVLRLAKGETPRDWLSDSLDEVSLASQQVLSV